MNAISFIKSKLDGKPYTEAGKTIAYLNSEYDSIVHAEPELFDYITLYVAYDKSSLVEIPTVGVEYEDEDSIVVNGDYFTSEEYWVSENKELCDCLYINWR